jgi:excinuclease ABC subunit C
MSREPDNSLTDDNLKNKLGLLPDAPGVYLHKNAQGKVIYVGKAKRLNHRVRSYFQSSTEEGGQADPKTKALVRRIRDFDYIVTDTDADALVLENQLIKEYRPVYNIRLKDDKQYPYIKITTDEAYPRVTVVRRIARDKARYFGPFTDVRAMREALNFTAGAFQIRTCHLDLPEQTVDRPCLDYQIGRCSAPCVDYDTQEGYRLKVQRMVKFLEGSSQEVLADLEAEMSQHAEALRFEEAARTRDLMARLDKTISRGRPVSGIQGDCDLVAVAREGEDASGVIFRVRLGKILTVHHFWLADKLDRGLPDFLRQLLREYYPRAGDIPRDILISQELDDLESWNVWLSNLRGGRVEVRHPQRGAKKDAVELAHTNAAFKLREVLRDKEMKRPARVTPADIQLQEALDLHTVPETIECFDISNFQGKETVASLVYFKGGKPLKSRYRRFRIKTVEGVDDFASMAEVLTRYYGRLIEKGESPADLVVVDGGIGQLSAARAVLAGFGLHEVQLIGLAKREETIVRETGEIKLSRHSEALKLLQRLRDEAHRFAITYHRLLRDKHTTASELDLIPGIGQVKKLSLLHHFGSVAQIRKATVEELTAVRLINRHDVLAIRAFFHHEDV